MKLSVFNTEGAETGRVVELPEDIFGLESNDHLVYLAVKAYQANQRQGTHQARERADVRGSTKKLKKQKGTGTARAGSIKSPVFRGGGRVFGPRPRVYNQKVNKKALRKARFTALSDMQRAGHIKVIENFTMEEPKTSQFKSIVENMNSDTRRTTFVVGEANKNVYLSSRNLQNAQVKVASDLSIYDILHAGTLVFDEGAIDSLSAQQSK